MTIIPLHTQPGTHLLSDHCSEEEPVHAVPVVGMLQAIKLNSSITPTDHSLMRRPILAKAENMMGTPNTMYTMQKH